MDPSRAEPDTRTAPQTPPASVRGPFAPGTKVGPYQFVEFLGQGAFGEVWLAERDSAIAKSRLAVKLPLLAATEVETVRREADVWIHAGNHPNVLPLFEANIYDGQVVIVSEYAADGSLKAWLDRHGGKAPSPAVAVEMAMGVLAGLEHLHVRKIVHRDLKPANVLMQGECPRIADFGLARRSDATLNTGGGIAGTVVYMAPEAFDGARTVQADLWSVGVMLYQLLSGGLPFSSPHGLMGMVKLLATTDPRPLPASIPAALGDVVRTALAKEPAERFRSAADMRAALRDALRQCETKIEAPVSGPPRVQTVAVTGTMSADSKRTGHRVPVLLAPYLGELTTWYCGTVGTVDECAASYLLEAGQRVIAVGYGAHDISDEMQRILDRYAAPFVDATGEPVPPVANPATQRDIFFATKADLVVVFWDGLSSGTGQLLAWLRQQGKDHLIAFV